MTDDDKGLDAIEDDDERAARLEAMSPGDHARRRFGRTEKERQPARRVKFSEATSEDHAARHRGEVELIPDDESEE